nr:hypothetical protein FOF69_03165 [Lactobacillus jensenii]
MAYTFHGLLLVGDYYNNYLPGDFMSNLKDESRYFKSSDSLSLQLTKDKNKTLQISIENPTLIKELFSENQELMLHLKDR